MDVSTKKITLYDFDSFFLMVLILSVPFIPFSSFRIQVANFSLSLPIIILSLYMYFKTIILIKKGLKIKINLVFSFLLLSFLFLSAVSTIWSKYENWDFIFELAFYILMTLFLINFCKIKRSVFFKVSNLLLLLTFLLILVGFFRLATGQSVWFEFENHFKTGLGTRNSDIFMVVATLPMAFTFFFLNRKFFNRLLAIILILFFVISVFFSLSRGQLIVSLLMLGVMPLIYAFLTRAKSKTVFKFLIVASLMFVFWFVLFDNLLHENYQMLINRFYHISESDRIGLAKLAWSIIETHLYTGIGIENFKLISPEGVHAHNAYLNIFAELGLFGIVLFCSILFYPALRYLRLFRRLKCLSDRRDKILYVQGFSMIIILITSSLFQSFYNYIFFWIVYMLTCLELFYLESKFTQKSLRKPCNGIL